MRRPRRLPAVLSLFGSIALLCGAVAMADDPDMKKILGDKVDPGWIYDDIDKGYAEARKSGKPMLVVFR